MNCDVCIVGAGFAGITAASRIQESGKSFVLLEARERPGGRTFTEDIGYSDIKLDVGGQWIGPTQKRVNQLVKKWDVPIFSTYDTGQNILNLDGKNRLYEGTIPKINPFALVELGLAMKRLDALARTVDVNEPWKTKGALDLDQISLGAWIERHIKTSSARMLMWNGLRMIFSTNPRRISLLHALYTIKVCDGLDILFGVKGGAQQDRFLLGSVFLIEKMIQPLSASILYNQPALSINQSENSVTIRTSQTQVNAKRVVITVPPSLLSRIAFSPELPYAKRTSASSMLPGSVIKFLIIYKTPFWRRQNLSGQAVYSHGHVFATFDNSLPNHSEGILVAFSIADDAVAIEQLSMEKRREEVLQSLVKAFGPQARDYLFFKEHIWAQEAWSLGAFFGNFPTGVLTQDAKEHWKSWGRVHWGGTETAREWLGYIEGAIESGERSASEVLALL